MVPVLRGSPPVDRRASAAPAKSLSFFGVLRLPGVRRLLVILFFVNFVGRSITPVLPTHLERLGVAQSISRSPRGSSSPAYAVMAALSATVLGRATRKQVAPGSPGGEPPGGSPDGAAHGPLSPSFATFLSLAVLLGLASGGALTLCYTMGGPLVPSEHKTTAFGFFSAAALFGGAVSPRWPDCSPGTTCSSSTA